MTGENDETRVNWSNHARMISVFVYRENPMVRVTSSMTPSSNMVFVQQLTQQLHEINASVDRSSLELQLGHATLQVQAWERKVIATGERTGDITVCMI